ncbi:response regulator [Sphingomonas abaci]|uniref:response regulator n=1 Tax=Sphingomonas abaci TaxID=237611 RepID=UPI0031B60324
MTLGGKRILVIEDEYYIAADLKRALLREGAVVLGPFNTVAIGLAAATVEPIDVAVVDVNLEGTPSFPIADVLSARGVPYLFLTGYDGITMPDGYRAHPRLAKPFTMEVVLDTLRDLVCPEVAL